MNLYHDWCNLMDGVKDTNFSDRAEFHLMVEFEDLAQVDRVFGHVATRAEPVESFHQAVNSLVKDTIFALYRDFPDAVRQRGQEKF